MRVDRPLLLLLSALTVGCADPEPFVDTGIVSYATPSLTKPIDSVIVTGQLYVCFSDKTPWAEVERLAAERCAAHGLTIYGSAVQRYQCRATSPHRALFRCYDPEMREANGLPVNPFDPEAVQRWEQRTGKTAKPHNAITGQALNQERAQDQNPGPDQGQDATAQPLPPGAALPPPASAPPAPAPVAPLSPADIANKPPIPALPPRPQAPPPPAAGAYPTDGFTLPQGSWGDHFQE